jgi:hypothetical protein
MQHALKPVFLSCLFVFLSNFLVAQEQGLDTIALKAELSSMKTDSLINELRSMLDSAGRNQSFFSINISASNRLFSTKNNAFNSQQSSAGVTAILPSFSYMHKSGLGLSATGYVWALMEPHRFIKWPSALHMIILGKNPCMAFPIPTTARMNN